MAHHLTMTVGAGILATVAIGAAAAEILQDPTRPPASLFAAAEGDAATVAATNSAYVLQSVLIGAGRRSAIIGGRQLAIGERLGGYTLVRIAETEVLLQGPEGSRTLKLFPGVDKRGALAIGNGPRLQKDPAQP